VSGPEATGPEPPDPPAPDGTPAPDSTLPSGPGGVFSLEGRAAPGLYLVAWLLGGLGLALAFIGLSADSGARVPFLLIGLSALAAGLASGAGYQVLARSEGPAAAYRGPSPILAFALAAIIGLVLNGVLLGQLALVDPEAPAGLLVGLLGVGAGYLVTIVFFVVRTGALSWSEMGWPAGQGRFGRLSRDAFFGAAVTIPAVLPVLLLASLLATLLGVSPTDRIPLVASRLDALLVVAAFAVVAPIGEELFFRGFVQSAWTRALGPRTALIRTAVFFALVHILNQTGTTFAEALGGALLQFGVILPLGFVLGWAFQRHGIAASIAGHVGYNATLLLLAALVR
jgi:membrane protease YdiL (CAAX protease family)